MPGLICAITLSLFFNQPYLNNHPEHEEVCLEVAEKAINSDLDPIIAVALSYSESRFTRAARSNVGAVGPLQVIPKWTCPNRRKKGCDLVQAGVDTLIKLREKHWGPLATPNWMKIICHYNSGNVCLDRRFPRLVLKRAEAIRIAMEE